MKELIAISPEGESAAEISVLAQLCAIGLGRYHVRKPHWSRGRLAAWLEAVPAEVRPRLVLHSHHELVERFGLGGRHWPDGPGAPLRAEAGRGWTSCSCHRLEDLAVKLGGFDTILFSPVFASESKPGRAPQTAAELAEVSRFLKSRSRAQRHTQVIALSGITPERVAECAELGFDGVAVMGGLGMGGPAGGPTPLFRFRQYQNACRPALPPVMCLTQDGGTRSHLRQVQELCAAGARCVQVRVKGADFATWRDIAQEATRICHGHGAYCLINDRPDIAVAVGADGAHVGQADGDWREARQILGRGKFLGGTVNDRDDARRAVEAGCLDYVGLGPLRFTATKAKLAPILGVPGVRRIVEELGELPAWIIGGVVPDDLPALCDVGASGVAVSSFLYRGDSVAAQLGALARAWPRADSGLAPAQPGMLALSARRPDSTRVGAAVLSNSG